MVRNGGTTRRLAVRVLLIAVRVLLNARFW